jgi:nitrate reductase delta subunit
MDSRARRYDGLADLFAYPEGDCAARLDRALEAMAGEHPAAVAALVPLRDRVRRMTLEETQEMYTRTFDINPICTLEVGWHVYGEDYARGAFLVAMRQRLREMNLQESRELPDHLTLVLGLLGRLSGEQADELAARYVLPALDKMLGDMDASGQPYRALLEAVRLVVARDHDVEAVPPRAPRGDPPGWQNPLPVFGTPCVGTTCPVKSSRGRAS